MVTLTSKVIALWHKEPRDYCICAQMHTCVALLLITFSNYSTEFEIFEISKNQQSFNIFASLLWEFTLKTLTKTRALCYETAKTDVT